VNGIKEEMVSLLKTGSMKDKKGWKGDANAGSGKCNELEWMK
jgi:hypothetical protein